VREIFREEAGRGTAILMTTHVLSIAEEVAARIGIIHLGRLIAVGTMEDLRAQADTGGHLEEIFFRITEGETPEHPP
jgi:ABC-2 type transport system ATP-binding protein